MIDIDLSQPKGAIFSNDAKYRYALWRVWQPHKPLLLFIGLNPSKAGQVNDDPTITRLISGAYHTHFGGLLAGNLFGLISTEPGVLLKDPDPVGEHTDNYLTKMIELSGAQLCAWGSFPPVKIRAPKVYPMLPSPFCLGVNKDGEPEHPLYVGYNRPIKDYCR